MARTKYKAQKLDANALRTEVLKLFKRNPKKRFTIKQLCNKLKKFSNSKDAINFAVAQLVKSQLVYPLEHEKYRLDRFNVKQKQTFDTKTYTGKVDKTRSGSGYIMVPELDDDIFVSSKNLKGAMNGDTVIVAMKNAPGRRRPEGKVKEVTARAISQVIGVFKELNNYGVILAQNGTSLLEINVKFNDFNKAENGKYVLAEVTTWGTSQNKANWGRVIEVLHDIDEHDLAMKNIVVQNGFELSFPKDVIKESEALTMEIPQHEMDARRDFRDVTTLTIDPLTAKDFDDALSLKKLEGDIIEIGVHIADVTHFVKSGTALDKEALSRSTSVYLVDRCIPMLPEKLSNNLCSLVPNEDRFCFSAVFKFNSKYEIVDRWFGKSVIHSNRRFTYEEAQEIIENKEGEFGEEILLMNTIAKHLRKEKYKNGAISFESDEVRFILDENNKPVDLYVKERKEAHLLVEDFMLLANKAVAEFISKKSKPQEIPFVFRVHDEPNPEKINDFALFAKELGFKMNVDTPKNIAKSFNELSQKAKTDESYKMLEPLAIRTMAKAVYTSDNIGHYGLAFKDYTHFTSPIRRYSDVLVHRLLEKNIYSTFRTDKAALEAQCNHISAQERKAMTAERESIKYKQVEYIMSHIGKEFDGIISGIIEKGIFVELKDSKAEGMISFDKFDQSYDTSQNRYKAIGNKNGKTLKIGDPIRVLILDASIESLQIEMEIVK